MKTAIDALAWDCTTRRTWIDADIEIEPLEIYRRTESGVWRIARLVSNADS